MLNGSGVATMEGMTEGEIRVRKLDVDDLIKLLGPIYRRNYRHRCVEAWSMVIPWDGFPLARLIDLAQPKPEAKLREGRIPEPTHRLHRMTQKFPAAALPWFSR